MDVGSLKFVNMHLNQSGSVFAYVDFTCISLKSPGEELPPGFIVFSGFLIAAAINPSNFPHLFHFF